MIEQLRKTANHWMVALGVVCMALLSGCQTGPKYTEVPEEAPGTIFHVGDALTVSAVPMNGDKTLIPDHMERIGEDGTISLPYIGQVKAVGKTASQLQKEIRELYVPQYYPGLTVTVFGENRYFYVDGDVRGPNKYEFTGEMTVVKAISVAGGFTDFANKKKVQVTHAGHKQIVNVPKAIDDPKLDISVYPGDKIWVPRRPF